MPVIDTMVLFAAGNTKDSFHDTAISHLGAICDQPDHYISSFVLLEFDLDHA